jgi:hypothetical protein
VDKLDEIERLRKRIKDSKAKLTRLERETREERYQTNFDEIISKPIEWEKMCWPTESSGSVGMSGSGMKEIYKCISCLKPIGKEPNFSGAYMGGGFGQPRFHVHRGCMPVWVMERLRNDIY